MAPSIVSIAIVKSPKSIASLGAVRSTLRIHWAIFGLLLLAGMISELIFFPWSYHAHPNHYYFYLGRILVFGIFIVATYKSSRPLWFFVLVVTSLKVVSLLKFYLTTDYAAMSTLYYEEYAGIFFRLKLPSVALLLFGNYLGSAVLLLGIYSYWLYLCEKLLRGGAAKNTL
jgi:hypothetical protein